MPALNDPYAALIFCLGLPVIFFNYVLRLTLLRVTVDHLFGFPSYIFNYVLRLTLLRVTVAGLFVFPSYIFSRLKPIFFLRFTDITRSTFFGDLLSEI